MQLALLFSVGIFVIIITVIRMPLILQGSAIQVDRSFVSLALPLSSRSSGR